MEKILLVNMPFCTIKSPAIGISLLKAKFHEEGIPCEIKYFNIDFAEMIGLDVYEEICNYSLRLIGERLFAQAYFGEQLPTDHEYIQYVERTQYYGGQNYTLDELLRIEAFVLPFLDHCVESIVLQNYDIIGFTTMFEQNLASIALAHRLKLLVPTKIIVFGGANCEAEMGMELHRCFPFIDYVCSGEADFSFPELVKRIREQKSVDDVPGVIYRKNGETKATLGFSIVKNLDVLPYPDYDDYFAKLELSSFSPSVCEKLYMETSRGCWWGERSQCKFCGLNRGTIGFRSKSKNRVISELTDLVKKYKVPHVFMVDNILDMNYFKELLPELKERHLPIQLFFEVKSNLNKEQVQMLYEAGITWIQPGIESLNTHILRLMAKGVSALQNVQLLKHCHQFDIFPQWNILTGFPGEKTEDYRQMVELIYNITHLPPPNGPLPIIFQRFSPYFNNFEKYGITNVRPENAYRFIYPFEDSHLFNLAYNFEFDYAGNVKPSRPDNELANAIKYWKECYANNENLYSIETTPSTLLIEDTRSKAIAPQTILESAQKDIYEYCDKIQNLSSIFSYVREKYSDYPVRERDIKDFLQEMVDLNLMVSEDDNYLSLAIPFDEKTPIA